MMLNRINKDLLAIKAHYFFYNAATGPIVPFLPLIARQLGFSGFLVGTIYTILPISGLVAKPLFGGLADKFQLHKSFFILFQIVLSVAFLAINFIPPIQKSTEAVIVCDDNPIKYLEICFNSKLRSEKDFKTLMQLSEKQLNITKNPECTLSCEVSQFNNKQLCDAWNFKEYCTAGANDLKDSKEEIEFQVHLRNYYDDALNCVTIRIENVMIDNETQKTACKGQLRLSCGAWCPKVPELDKLLKFIRDNDKSKAIEKSTYQFHLFVWAAVISWIGMAVVVSIGDAICFDQLGNNTKDYGKQKMWGSIGFGIFGIGGGYLVDVLSTDGAVKDYSCIFYIMLVAMIFDIIVSSKLKKKNLDNIISDPSVFWELGSIAREGRVLVFAWWCVGAGMCTGVIWNFLFWYTEELSSWSKVDYLKTLQGLLTGVQCFLGEMPFNFISGALLKKIGHINVMSLVLLVYAIRFMAYSLLSNPWMFLIVEILHGPSLGLCWPTMVSYGDKVAPSGTKATIQGLVGAVFEGIGVSLGSLLCGYLMDELQGKVVFKIFSVGALLWLSIFWILQVLLQKAKAYPLQQGHIHLANYYPPDDALFVTTSQEMQTY